MTLAVAVLSAASFFSVGLWLFDADPHTSTLNAHRFRPRRRSAARRRR